MPQTILCLDMYKNTFLDNFVITFFHIFRNQHTDKMKQTVLLITLLSLALADKPDPIYKSPTQQTKSVQSKEKVDKIQARQDQYGAPAAPAQDSYGSPSAPDQRSGSGAPTSMVRHRSRRPLRLQCARGTHQH